MLTFLDGLMECAYESLINADDNVHHSVNFNAVTCMTICLTNERTLTCTHMHIFTVNFICYCAAVALPKFNVPEL